MAKNPHLVINIRSSTGVITLDRPKALNALTQEMCVEMIGVLEGWAGNPAIDRVLVTAAPGRAFCAGGDVRSMVSYIKDDIAKGDYFLQTEYTLDSLISVFPKPLVVLADGLTMGGGAGVLLNAAHPVVTTAMDFSMPETAIGLFPDVGAALFLRRAPRAVAVFLGMTGWRVGAGDMLRYGIAPLAVEEGKAEAVAEAVINAPDAPAVEAALDGFRTSPADTPLADAEDWVTDRFSGPDAASIRAGLEGDGHPMAEKARQALDSRCPLSIAVTHRMLTDPGLAPTDAVAALQQDYRLGTRMIRRPDFSEGVRAVLIDKDNSPNWRPGSLDDVTPDMVDAIVAPDGASGFKPETPLVTVA